ncbi:MAG: hypothetical protein IPO19_12130 [Rhodoferax sp.]|nr:hypothetical protein [Rhodoferax sp.]
MNASFAWATKDLGNQIPFNTLGFHSDNGSQYINKAVAILLAKMRGRRPGCIFQPIVDGVSG